MAPCASADASLPTPLVAGTAVPARRSGVGSPPRDGPTLDGRARPAHPGADPGSGGHGRSRRGRRGPPRPPSSGGARPNSPAGGPLRRPRRGRARPAAGSTRLARPGRPARRRGGRHQRGGARTTYTAGAVQRRHAVTPPGRRRCPSDRRRGGPGHPSRLDREVPVDDAAMARLHGVCARSTPTSRPVSTPDGTGGPSALAWAVGGSVPARPAAVARPSTCGGGGRRAARSATSAPCP